MTGTAGITVGATADECPRLSVVIPCYNAREPVARAIQALCGQDRRDDWEIVVADNGSTDGSEQRVRELAVEHPRVRLVDASARRGAAAARNMGAAAA